MLNRVILAIELIILCGPASALLLLGITYLPLSLAMLVSGREGLYIFSLITISGMWGFISLASLTWHTFSYENKWPGRPIQWFGIALGVTACVMGLSVSVLEKSEIMAFVFAGPILATAHLLYLSKKRGLAS